MNGEEDGITGTAVACFITLYEVYEETHNSMQPHEGGQAKLWQILYFGCPFQSTNLGPGSLWLEVYDAQEESPNLCNAIVLSWIIRVIVRI
jgi:hypothetical protein